LLPDAIIEAASILWSTTFAVLASTEAFKVLSPPLNGTVIHNTEVSRLVVVSPIAYIILAVLMVVAILNISLFFYASERSILLEEPVGLVSAAGILHRSTVNVIVDKFVTGSRFDGRITEYMKNKDELMIDRYSFDEQQRRIIKHGSIGFEDADAELASETRCRVCLLRTHTSTV
jgi:hypothetical protein